MASSGTDPRHTRLRKDRTHTPEQGSTLWNLPQVHNWENSSSTIDDEDTSGIRIENYLNQDREVDPWTPCNPRHISRQNLPRSHSGWRIESHLGQDAAELKKSFTLLGTESIPPFLGGEIQPYNTAKLQIPAAASEYATYDHVRFWNNILLPQLAQETKNIIGEAAGCIAFIASALDSRPIIRILTKDKNSVNIGPVRKILYKSLHRSEYPPHLRFDIEVITGCILRSQHSEEVATPHEYPQDGYQEKPTPGAVIGLGQATGRSGRIQTFGGYVKLFYTDKDGKEQKEINAVTCHHMIKDFSKAGGDECNAGVKCGKLGDMEFPVHQPALGCALHTESEKPSEFGKIAVSSGYTRCRYKVHALRHVTYQV
jgi:hypothetical protein